jgi:hypothetical protein
MDFLERWFHVSPDGGSGSLESAYVLTAVAVAAAVIRRRAVAAFCKALVTALFAVKR